MKDNSENKISLELLAPAGNAEIGIEAIKHGADAVYIGPPSHGARKSAANSIDDIARVVDFAHNFHARVYATVNTIIYENELKGVERLCRDLYRVGVDALIIQDMALLRMDLPPIALHASTQCDIRTPEKAKFLEEAGFSQLVLARELSIKEIEAITKSVTIPVECFVHGALCVSYSGRCHASFMVSGRSANRGECAQICRWAFNLTDKEGNVFCKDKYLLSLRDLNLSEDLELLINAGVTSFKIEGRMKEMGYVKNITSIYSQRLNRIIEESGGRFARSSFGNIRYNFIPEAEKSFNRGFTQYNVLPENRRQISSFLTPKSLGEEIKDIKSLNNGDGISYFDKTGNYCGVNINKIIGDKILTQSSAIDSRRILPVFRTKDISWDKLMSKETAERKIDLDIIIDGKKIRATDQRGIEVALAWHESFEKALTKPDYSSDFSRLGNTIYRLKTFIEEKDFDLFIPKSQLSSFRRKLIDLLDKANQTTYPFSYRRKENLNSTYPYGELTFGDNVANSLSEKFYYDHGIRKFQKALEVSGRDHKNTDKLVMTSRHCILRELGLCSNHSRENKKPKSVIDEFIEKARCELKHKYQGNIEKLKNSLYLTSGPHRFKLKFNCQNCEMQVFICRQGKK